MQAHHYGGIRIQYIHAYTHPTTCVQQDIPCKSILSHTHTNTISSMECVPYNTTPHHPTPLHRCTRGYTYYAYVVVECIRVLTHTTERTNSTYYYTIYHTCSLTCIHTYIHAECIQQSNITSLHVPSRSVCSLLLLQARPGEEEPRLATR